jgi:diguanylate cyclase (GGDEF)-like protein
VGALAWGAGSLVWLWFARDGGEPPYPGPQDLGYLAMPALALLAIARFPTERPRRRGAVHVVDAMLTAAATLLILWVGALRWAVQGDGTSLVESTVNLAYPLTDAVLIMLLVDLMRRVPRARRPPLALVTGGLGCMAVSDILLLVLEAYGTYQTTSLLTDASWTVGWVLVGGAAVLAPIVPRAGRAAPVSGTAASSMAEDHDLPMSRVPLALAVVALVAGLVAISLQPTDVPWTVPLSILVIGLLLAREALTLHANRELAVELSRSVRELAHAADHDGLTGLHNRVELEQRILLAATRSAALGSLAAVAFVDIDHLKAVNDSLGHAAGDLLIATTAERLRAAATADSPGPGGRSGDVTRFGGDEFVVVLSGLRPNEVLTRVGSLLELGSRPVHLAGVEIRPSISAGVALASGGVDPRELLRRSDVALYRAKAAGRHQAVVYEPSMDADTRRRLELEPELLAALARDEFVLHYQPVVDPSTGAVQGAEALLRWDHPTRGLLTPDAFLDDADDLGLLGEIGARTLRRAAADFASLGRSRPGTDLTVAVNLSASELSDGQALERVRSSLDEAGLDPSALVLEIREDVVVDETTRRAIDDLAEAGVGIAIDDFGTGHSSLRQLGSYPASLLKIDRTFVDGLGTEPEDTFVVRAVLNLAHNLGLRTVAEGVETETQLRLLADLGCDGAQGWLFGRPVPFDEFVARYAAGPVSRRTDRRAPPRPAR